jgi:hypothetical protein
MVQWLTSGGDERIVIDPATGLNRYHSSPVPTDGLVLASSTANDLSASGQAFLQDNFAAEAHSLTSGAAYEELLDRFRQSIRSSYGLGERADVFFAPSGTDLEYVGLLAAAGRRAGGIANFLLGADEIGSGCIHSAAGHYFAQQTALDVAVKPGQPVKGLPPVTLWDLPIRCEMGLARQSDALLQEMEKSIVAAQAQDQFPLLHIVHGSKTGLVLPTLDHVDALINRFGSGIGFVVDACQARITQQAVRDYLDREIIVFITGSKFMGGPPFSGFALVPDGLAASSHPIPEGMADVFRRGEIPSSWPGREFCSDTGNPGLALRLAASLYELERFQNLEIDRIRRVVSAFTAATEDLARTMDVRKVASAPAGHAEEIAEHPIEMQTLVTIDLTRSRNGEHLRELTFDDAQAMHCALVPSGIRLGQPVRCVRLRNGDWGATLRIGISMPQVTMLDAMDDDQMHQWLGNAMDRIGRALAEMLER